MFSFPFSKLILVITFLIGLPFLAIGIYEGYEVIQLQQNSIAVEGKVIGNEWESFSTDGAAYVPVVEFTTKGGENVRFKDGIGSFPPDYEPGDMVSVLYNPKNASEARVNSWKRMWMGPAIITGVGLLPLTVSLIVILMANRKFSKNR